MKLLTYLGVLIFFVTLGGCCQDDCDNSTYLSFRVVDQTGRDLVLTLDVPVDSIKVTTAAGTRLNVYQVFSEPAYLTVGFTSSEDQVILSYEHRQTTVNITQKVIDKSRCCGDAYGIDTLEASSGTVSTELTPNGKATIFVIKL